MPEAVIGILFRDPQSGKFRELGTGHIKTCPKKRPEDGNLPKDGI